MSGIELVGLAASVLQIADLGWKSSYKLYAFSKKIHDAGKSIELVSQDIAATGAILKQLGDELKRDEESTPASRLGTQGLIVAASQLIDECQTLFKEIDQGITGEQGSKVILGFKQKLKWSYLEPRVDLLRTNLERLKSSLALMLNVLIYAEQQRSRQGDSVLKEQQQLVASFAEQKQQSEKRIVELQRRIEPTAPVLDPEVTKPSPQIPAEPVPPSYDHAIADPVPQNPKSAVNVAAARTGISANMSAVQIPRSIQDVSAAKFTRKPVPTRERVVKSEFTSQEEPSGADREHSQLEHHRLLIDSILEEVNSSKYALDHGLRYRLHDGVLELHWREWEPLRATHGDQKLMAILSRSPLLSRHWYKMAMEHGEIASSRTGAALVAAPQQETQVPSAARERLKERLQGNSIEKANDQAQTYKTSQYSLPTPEKENIEALKPETRATDQEGVLSARDGSRATGYLSLWSRESSSRNPMLRRTLVSTKEDDGDNEDCSQISKALRAYYTEKGRAFPEWLPPDPKPSPIPKPPPNQYGNPYSSQTGGYGAYGDRQLTAEEEEEEDIQATKQEIRFMKQRDVATTRNAIRNAAQTEESGRNTLARLGAQGERIYDRDTTIRTTSINVSGEMAKEPKTLNRSMFAVHVTNPFAARDRRINQEKEMLDRHMKAREALKPTQEPTVEPEQAIKDEPKATDNRSDSKQKIPLAESARYQFEADDDDSTEDDIDQYLNKLSVREKTPNRLVDKPEVAPNEPSASGPEIVKPEPLSQEEVENFKEVFALFDQDGSGTITTSEIGNMMRSLGQTLTESQVDDMMKEANVSQGSHITLDDFLKIMTTSTKPTDSAEEMKAAFKVFGKDDGTISAAELRSVMTSLGEKLTEEEIDKMIAETDGDETGNIDYSKFVDNVLAPKNPSISAERAKYQFEADSDEDDQEEMDEENLEILHGAAKRLNSLARATGGEVEAQNRLIQRVAAKSDTLGGEVPSSNPAASIADQYLRKWTTVKPTMSFNSERLRRIR